jgi:DNA processing protein
MPPTPDAYWLALRRIHGVGPRTCRLLLDRFGSAEQIFKTPEAEIAAAGVPRQVAHAIVSFTDFAPLEKELCELPRLGARLVRWTDADYPPNLKHIADPPPYLFARGVLTPEDRGSVAVVGARAASDAGLRMAERLGFELAAHGFIVVSGLARGIDGAAHRGALQANGRTVAVLGCGIDVAYPPEHRQLAETIVEQGGAILSELPLGTAPVPENFPSRNRILSGLSLGVVIVEAAEKSGSLITARLALEQDRQVFAVPGSPLSGKTRGSNRLIKQGALLVECVEDVIEDLAPQLAGLTSKPNTEPTASHAPAASPAATRPGLPTAQAAPPRKGDRSTQIAAKRPPAAGGEAFVGSSDEEFEQIKTILSCLTDAEKLHVDAVIESCQLTPQTVLKLLLELELRGMVVQHPGKLFSLP